MVSCYKLFGVRSFVLEVRSQSSNEVTINLYQMLLCSDKKGQGPKAQLCPLRYQPMPSMLRGVRPQLRLPQGQVPRPAQLSSLGDPGAHPTDPQAPQASQRMGGAGSRRLQPRPTAASTSRAVIRQGLGSCMGHSPQLVPWAPQLTRWPKAR